MSIVLRTTLDSFGIHSVLCYNFECYEYFLSHKSYFDDFHVFFRYLVFDWFLRLVTSYCVSYVYLRTVFRNFCQLYSGLKEYLKLKRVNSNSSNSSVCV